MNRKNLFLLLAVAIISSVVAACITCLILSDKNRGVYSNFFANTSFSANSSNNHAIMPNVHEKTSNVFALDFTYASEKSIHAVTHVKTISYIQDRYDPFEFFFGFPFYTPQPRQQIGMGSGVIISPDGYIVTNNHVIAGTSGIEVTLNNKQTFQAEIVGSDPATDIALLKIDANNLSFLNFGNSDTLKIGEWVLAVGNPFNLTSTVTAGIVSAKGRSLGIISGSMGIESFIQTDAAVNAGNSGGALVNTQGELVGINTAIASPTGNFSGYSFAVPASIAQKVVDDLMKFGSVQRASLTGVGMMDLDAETARAYNVKTDDYRGILVVHVASGSAADKEGMKAGDIIIEINDIKITSLSVLQEQLEHYRPGNKVKFTIVRGGKEKRLEIILE